MAAPVSSSYTVAAGQPIYGGKHRSGFPRGATLGAVEAGGYFGSNPSLFAAGATLGAVAGSGALQGFVPPTWWTSAPVGQWVAISGTAGPAAGLNTNIFCDMALRPSDSTLFVAAAGGHDGGSSNAAASLRLIDNSPQWATLRASSTPTADVLYYGDGRPTSRHTYHHTHYLPSLDAILLAGCRFGYGPNTPTGPGMDLFDLATNDYLPRYTWPDLTPWGSTGYGVVQDGAGNIWTQGGYKVDGTTGVATKPGTGNLLRYPAAYDSIRNKIFALQFDDGEGFGGAGLQAKQLDPTTGNSQTISFNSSAALTAFVAAGPDYAGMAYCPLDGKFYFMDPATPQTLYVVTPNAGTTWDMTTLVVSGAALPAPPSGDGGICKRFLWVPGLNGFVVQTNQANNLHFMRMA